MNTRKIKLLIFTSIWLLIGTACASTASPPSSPPPQIPTVATLVSANTPVPPTLAPTAAPTPIPTDSSVPAVIPSLMPTIAAVAPTAAPTPNPTDSSVPALIPSPIPTIAAITPTATSAPSGITCQQDPNALITRLVVSKPTTRTITDFKTLYTLAGSVYIYATTNRPSFSYWKVEYSGDDRKTWANVALRGLVTTPVVDQQIVAWNTDLIPNGEYWLRILVVDKAGNYNPPCELRFLVRNEQQITGTTGACVDPNAVISSVKNDQIVSGRLLIAGSANRDNFSYFETQFSSDQKNWTRLSRMIRPAVNESLFSWDTITVPNGDYWIRLLVIDKSGNYNQPCAVHVVVKN